MVTVVADANTLFGAPPRGLLIHLDYQGVIRLHWSPLILDEMSRALVDAGRKPDAESARRHGQLMRAALPQAEIATQQVRTAFGWKGTKLAIERIHEALAEIRAVARHDPASAAEGAVLFRQLPRSRHAGRAGPRPSKHPPSRLAHRWAPGRARAWSNR